MGKLSKHSGPSSILSQDQPAQCLHHIAKSFLASKWTTLTSWRWSAWVPFALSLISCVDPYLMTSGKYLARKMKNAQNAQSSAKAAFDKLDNAMLKQYKETWLEEERWVLNQRVSDPSVMDMLQVKTNKGIFSTAILHSELTVKLILQHQPCGPLNWTWSQNDNLHLAPCKVRPPGCHVVSILRRLVSLSKWTTRWVDQIPQSFIAWHWPAEWSTSLLTFRNFSLRPQHSLETPLLTWKRCMATWRVRVRMKVTWLKIATYSPFHHQPFHSLQHWVEPHVINMALLNWQTKSCCYKPARQMMYFMLSAWPWQTRPFFFDVMFTKWKVRWQTHEHGEESSLLMLSSGGMQPYTENVVVQWFPWVQKQKYFNDTRPSAMQIYKWPQVSSIQMGVDIGMRTLHGFGWWIYPKTPMWVTGCLNVSNQILLCSLHNQISSSAHSDVVWGHVEFLVS